MSRRSVLSSGVRLVRGMSKKSGPAVARFSCEERQLDEIKRLEFTLVGEMTSSE